MSGAVGRNIYVALVGDCYPSGLVYNSRARQILLWSVRVSEYWRKRCRPYNKCVAIGLYTWTSNSKALMAAPPMRVRSEYQSILVPLWVCSWKMAVCAPQPASDTRGCAESVGLMVLILGQALSIYIYILGRIIVNPLVFYFYKFFYSLRP